MFMEGACLWTPILQTIQQTAKELNMVDDVGAYRLRMEESVSGLTGTSMTEILLVSIPIPLGVLVLAEAKALSALQCGRKATSKPDVHMTLPDFMAEVLLLVFPALASMVWPSLAPVILTSMIITSICCRIVQRTRSGTACPTSGAVLSTRTFDAWGGNGFTFPRPDVVTHFRASIMVMTCITILAVDFQVFPRRFAKTEEFGTGLMDLGVGAIVFASGLASGCKARRQGAKKSSPRPSLLLVELASIAVRSWPIAALGVSRLVVIKGLGYQEHVSEYGVHWNFFATLFCLRVVVVALSRMRPARARLFLALAALGVYQWMLLGDLRAFIVDAPRLTFFSMNREGILGLISFVAIYYIAEELGKWLSGYLRKVTKESGSKRSTPFPMPALLGADIVLWMCTWLSNEFVQRTSRRMMNLTYVLWVSAHLTFMLTVLIAIEMVSSKPSRSQVLAAVNRNMFPVFMAANVATGAVNISMRTLDTAPWAAGVTLSIHVIFFTGFAVILANRGILVKV